MAPFNNFDAPDYTSVEDVVTVGKNDEFEQEAGRKLTWVYFTKHWFKGLAFPLRTVLLSGATARSRSCVSRTSTTPEPEQPRPVAPKIVSVTFDLDYVDPTI